MKHTNYKSLIIFAMKFSEKIKASSMVNIFHNSFCLSFSLSISFSSHTGGAHIKKVKNIRTNSVQNHGGHPLNQVLGYATTQVKFWFPIQPNPNQNQIKSNPKESNQETCQARNQFDEAIYLFIFILTLIS